MTLVTTAALFYMPVIYVIYNNNDLQIIYIRKKIEEFVLLYHLKLEKHLFC